MLQNALSIPSDWRLAHETTDPTVLTLEPAHEAPDRRLAVTELPSTWRVLLRDQGETIHKDTRRDATAAAALAETMMDAADLLCRLAAATSSTSQATTSAHRTTSTASSPSQSQSQSPSPSHRCPSARPGVKPLDTLYVGRVTDAGRVVTVDGDPLSVRWSRTDAVDGGGFAWGQAPDDDDTIRLATALLLDYYDDLAYAQAWCEPLAADVLATLDDSWRLCGAEFDGIMARLEARHGLSNEKTATEGRPAASSRDDDSRQGGVAG